MGLRQVFGNPVVCPDCGTPMAKSPTCTECGRDLMEGPGLPLASEWRRDLKAGSTPAAPPQPAAVVDVTPRPASAFTAACRAQARGAFAAAAAWPEKYANWKKGPGAGGRAQRGCLGVLIFGLVYVFVPLIVFVFVEICLLGYGLLASVLWGVGVGVDSVTSRRGA